MGTRERRNGGRRLKRQRAPAYEEVNPMESVSNMADVMLVLAVGMMLALVLRWKVPVGQQPGEDKGTGGAVTVTEDDLDVRQQLPEDARQAGYVYYDEKTGEYYIVPEGPAFPQPQP